MYPMLPRELGAERIAGLHNRAVQARRGVAAGRARAPDRAACASGSPETVRPFIAANLALAFALELVAFVALAYGAVHLANSTTLGVLLAVGSVLGAATLWGLFAAPRAPRRSALGAVGVKVFVFAAATAALVFNDHLLPGTALAVAVALNALVLHSAERSRLVCRRAPTADLDTSRCNSLAGDGQW